MTAETAAPLSATAGGTGTSRRIALSPLRLVVLILSTAWLSIQAAVAIEKATQPGHNWQLVQTTQAEFDRGWVEGVTDPNLVVLLRFKPAKEIEDERHAGVVAYAAINLRPCEIVLPSGITIVGDTRDQNASFVDGSYVEMIAHELLHCIRGGWHGK